MVNPSGMSAGVINIAEMEMPAKIFGKEGCPARSLGAALTFWIYAEICLPGFVIIEPRLPETTGKTLEDNESIWGGGS